MCVFYKHFVYTYLMCFLLSLRHTLRLTGLDSASLSVSTCLSHHQQNALLQLYVLDRLLFFVRRSRSLPELAGLPELFGPCFASCLLPSQLPVPLIRKMLFALCSPSLHWLTEDMYLPEPLLLRASHARSELEGEEGERGSPLSGAPQKAGLVGEGGREKTPKGVQVEDTSAAGGSAEQQQHWLLKVKQQSQQQEYEQVEKALGSRKVSHLQQMKVNKAGAPPPAHIIMSAVEQFLAATSGAHKKGVSSSGGVPPGWMGGQQQHRQQSAPMQEANHTPCAGPEESIDPAAGLEALRKRGSAACMSTTSSEVVAYVIAKERQGNAAAAAAAAAPLLIPQRHQPHP